MSASDTAFIFSRKAHGASAAFASAINADFCSVSRASLHKIFTLPARRKYFVESAFALTYPVIRKKLGEKSKIVFRCNANLFSGEPGRYFQGNAVVRAYLKFLLRHTDGIIAVSRMVQRDADAKCIAHIERRIASRLVYSFVDAEKWRGVKPALSSNSFLHIGYLRHHKGIDILMQTFEKLAERRSDAKLYLAGISDSDLRRYKIKKARNAVALGFVKDMRSIAKQCAFYIATPRYEPGPTASLEAMASGLIPVVNYMTGHKDHVEQVSAKLVINSLHPHIVAERLEEIIAMKNRAMLSKKARRIAARYSRESQVAAFRKAFAELVA